MVTKRIFSKVLVQFASAKLRPVVIWGKEKKVVVFEEMPPHKNPHINISICFCVHRYVCTYSILANISKIN